MSSFTILPDASLRKPATLLHFFFFILSVYIHAVLVILLPKTRKLQQLLLPITLSLAWTCVVHRGYRICAKDRMGYLNTFWMILLTIQTLRAIEWTLQRDPYRRLDPPVDGAPSIERLTFRTVLLHALDLSFNLRGIGWSWTRNPFPALQELRPIPVQLFLIIIQLLVFDTLHAFVQWSHPSLNRPEGDTLFDPSLAPFPRILWACVATFCAGMLIFLALDTGHGICAVIARIFLRHPAWHWPPLFSAPWAATSLADFWGRWHQLFRRQFSFFGRLLGSAFRSRRAGALLGAFVLSGLLHDLGTWGLRAEGGAEPLSVSAFFVAMGAGIMLEQFWKPRGVLGWIWTYAWTIGWATRWMDAWARRGVFASMFAQEWLRPGKMIVECVTHATTTKGSA
ncbi:membrane bound O-acyl transferase family-domain-containing protein [Vararia minispora EC-137]|uniref:Membrane bound O-acyl transferase family-domain-containing protein n=1 Tax=Vararia minispora EC-137 TaxID=1314806 RepID=A0ACB8QC92_9AGAM|nr:membrane bound O-acyl transferase family-domain-containing protein [Vararia minispora EC-137]